MYIVFVSDRSGQTKKQGDPHDNKGKEIGKSNEPCSSATSMPEDEIKELAEKLISAIENKESSSQPHKKPQF